MLEGYRTSKKIDNGYSDDEKWIVDNTYLVRLTPNSLENIQHQKELINAVHQVDSRIPFVYEASQSQGINYSVLDYIPGEDAERLLPNLEPDIQYNIGIQVGDALKNMHSIAAPDNYPSWECRWKERYCRLRPAFEAIVKDNPDYQNILPFIDDNLYLLKNRPSAIQHYDFHPGNILIDKENFVGLIDFQKVTYADPVNEFYKLEYFTVQHSREFACGIIDGYHQQKPIPKDFWRLHRLYAAIHIVSAEVWGHTGALNQKDTFQQNTRFTIAQFNNFNRLIPTWYQGI